VLAAGSDSVKTAIVCPPTIYGPGRGPGNKKSRQVYVLAEMTLKRRQAPILGKGLTEWDNVHVHDLSDLFVLLVEAAIKSKAGETKDIDAELWNERGYFLAENGHQYVHTFIISRKNILTVVVFGVRFHTGLPKTHSAKVISKPKK